MKALKIKAILSNFFENLSLERILIIVSKVKEINIISKPIRKMIIFIRNFKGVSEIYPKGKEKSLGSK